MTDENMRAVIDTAQEAVRVSNRIGLIGDVPFVVLHESERAHILSDALRLSMEQEPQPQRMRGQATHHELESFQDYVNAHKTSATVVWANWETTTVFAVFNHHEGSESPGWGDFSAKYVCPKSPEWKAWRGAEDVLMSGEQFADFIDGHQDDLVTGDGLPAPVDIMQMARNLQVHTRGTFIRKVDPHTGEYEMLSKQEHDERTTKIPRKFGLALRVFVGGDQYAIEARVRFKVREGKPLFAFSLHRADEVAMDAFGDIRKSVAEKCAVPVYAGIPGDAK